MKESHIQNGFRAAGIFSLNKSAIPPWKLAPSLPFTSESSHTSSTSEGPPKTSIHTELRQSYIREQMEKQRKQTEGRFKYILRGSTDK